VSYEDVGFEPHQLCRERRKTLSVSFRPAVFDHKGLSHFVPQITEALAKCVEKDRIVGGGRGAEEADPIDPQRLLRPSSERRKKIERENDRESDQPHGTSVGMAGWSLAERRDAHQRPGLDEDRGAAWGKKTKGPRPSRCSGANAARFLCLILSLTHRSSSVAMGLSRGRDTLLTARKDTMRYDGDMRRGDPGRT
jgi:hypothetical protein